MKRGKIKIIKTAAKAEIKEGESQGWFKFRGPQNMYINLLNKNDVPGREIYFAFTFLTTAHMCAKLSESLKQEGREDSSSHCLCFKYRLELNVTAFTWDMEIMVNTGSQKDEGWGRLRTLCCTSTWPSHLHPSLHFTVHFPWILSGSCCGYCSI